MGSRTLVNGAELERGRLGDQCDGNGVCAIGARKTAKLSGHRQESVSYACHAQPASISGNRGGLPSLRECAVHIRVGKACPRHPPSSTPSGRRRIGSRQWLGRDEGSLVDRIGHGRALEGCCGQVPGRFVWFLTPSGVDEFPCVTEGDLWQALPELARLGAVLLVHAESPALLQPIASDPLRYSNYLNSRPRASEQDAIALTI
jgi:hypothetical protein